MKIRRDYFKEIHEAMLKAGYPDCFHAAEEPAIQPDASIRFLRTADAMLEEKNGPRNGAYHISAGEFRELAEKAERMARHLGMDYIVEIDCGIGSLCLSCCELNLDSTAAASDLALLSQLAAKADRLCFEPSERYGDTAVILSFLYLLNGSSDEAIPHLSPLRPSSAVIQ